MKRWYPNYINIWIIKSLNYVCIFLRTFEKMFNCGTNKKLTFINQHWRNLYRIKQFLYYQSNYIHKYLLCIFPKQMPFKSHSSQTAKAIILFYLVCKLHIDQSLSTCLQFWWCIEYQNEYRMNTAARRRFFFIYYSFFILLLHACLFGVTQ